MRDPMIPPTPPTPPAGRTPPATPTAEVLFDHPTSRAATSAPPAPAPGPASVPAPPPAPPPAGESPRPSDAEVLFDRGPTEHYRSVLTDGVHRLGDVAGLDAAGREALLADAAAFFDALGIPPAQAVRLVGRVVVHAAHPPSDEQADEMAADARRQLREDVGAEEADRRLAAAQAVVKAHPSLARWLHHTGAGSDPELVRALAEAVARRRGRGGA